MQQCERKWKKVGCFHDNVKKRVLPYELLNRRDPSNHNYDGVTIDWGDYPQSLQGYVQVMLLFITYLPHLYLLDIFLLCTVQIYACRNTSKNKAIYIKKTISEYRSKKFPSKFQHTYQNMLSYTDTEFVKL